MNELSYKLKYKTIVHVFTSIDDIVRDITDKFRVAKSRLGTYCRKVVLCDLIRLWFRIYNIDNTDYPDQQYAVNLAVVRINMRMDEINRSNGVCESGMEDFLIDI